ncbi:hypothetical protein BKA66DRAFT_572553 [Pyrenochaeta sp. MPI-SDFR-AT-0127]|nr:hypothetical protein BKA66DRAFT_572553 [Pyrenochaeta sp. MPI-SDFR-AT-0127]
MFYIEKECGNLNITRDSHCGIDRGNGTSGVISYGSVMKGKFEGDPDIAGIGVLIAFLLVSVLVGGLGIILSIVHWYSVIRAWIKSKKVMFPNKDYNEDSLCDKFHALLDPIILSGSDAQVLLIYAYGISFQISSKCSISGYHYNIVLHVIFVGCATFVLSIIFVQKYFLKPITALLRIVSMVIILSVYGTFLRIQSANFDPMTIIPKVGTTDSDLFLPAMCLLDAGSVDVNISAPKNLMRNFFYFIGLFFAIAVLMHALPPVARYFQITKRKGLTIKSAFGINIGKTLMYAVLLVFIGVEWSVIMRLRKWVDQSGWMDTEEGNPEMDAKGIGQLAPLIALSAIGIPISDKASEWVAKRLGWGKFRDSTGSNGNNMELQNRQ